MENTPVQPAQTKAVVIKKTLLPAVLIGLIVSVVIMGLSFVIPPLVGNLSNSFTGIGQMLTTVLIIVVLLLYGLVLITPSLWFGTKRGWKGAVLVIVFELVWLVVLTFLAVLLFSARTYQQPPFPINCPNCGSYPISTPDKPVIYLYPTNKEQVSVQLNYGGTITDTYPQFDNQKAQTWNVTAYPDGRLTDFADGKNYNYLFWEGADNQQYDLSSGFVVKGSDTALFLQNQLAKMGLQPKEYNEFIVYWLPKMQHNPYNLIHFAGDDYTNFAKLNILPKPDSILRVFMVYKPLNQPVSILPQLFPTFSRNGFSVVEWGGEEAK